MSRRDLKKNSWKTRLSAGGANRTNLHGPKSRPSNSTVLPRYSNEPSGSDLMPVPRLNSFKPWNSCLTAAPRRSPPRYSREWEPPPRYANEYEPHCSRDRSPELIFDDKGRPVPKRGMFMNAKCSHVVHPKPSIDEQRVQQTEEQITRMIQKGRRKHDLHPNYAIRDQVRKTIYNLGVPENYRIQNNHYPPYPPEEYQQYPGPSHIHHSNHRRDEFEEDSESEDEVFYEREKSRKRQILPHDEEEGHRNISRSSRKSVNFVAAKKQKRVEMPAYESSSGEESEENEKSGNASLRKGNISKDKDDRAPSCESKCSSKNTSRNSINISHSSTPQYIRDPDDDDKWKNSLDFMNSSDSAGTAILQRVGSAITAIPLRDDSKHSYSKVALMLLGKSMQNLNKPSEDRKEHREGLQTQLLNMSTSWAVHNNNKKLFQNNRQAMESEASLMHDISKIRNPQNATTVQIDRSIFSIPNNFQTEKVAEKRKKLPPPLFRSSPKRSDIFRSSEGITALSSIRRDIQEEFPLRFHTSEDEEEPETRHPDIDDYIAQGASQIDFSQFSESPQSSSRKSSDDIITNSSRNNTMIHRSSNDFVRESYSKKMSDANESHRRENYIDTAPTSSGSKSKVDASTMELNSRFMFSTKRNKSGSQPMLDIDEETRKMFDNVFDSEKSDKQKYMF